tara:strand:- start:1051 stop:1908 length:858 start_codon:yes stop_codon:yes gene_type:complete
MINLPPFLLRDINLEKISFIKKIYLIVFGKFLSLIINKTTGKVFCYFINIFFKSDGKLFFKENKYFKQLKNKKEIYYPNKRILRIVKNVDFQFNLILNTYMLKDIGLKDDDVVIDCGANIGELGLALNSYGIDVKYFAFEPEEETFNCLLKNVNNTEYVFNDALGEENKTKTFYLDSYGGNSSLIDFGTDKKEEVNVITLDSLNFEFPIKVFKVEAEGYEPEVLEGSRNTLKLIEYVTIDFGAERGVDHENTVVEVNNILLRNNFELIKFSNLRTIGLYKNKDYE